MLTHSTDLLKQTLGRLTDVRRSMEIDGEAMSFENWAAGEPNDASGGENALLPKWRSWNDLPKHSLSGYIIEADSHTPCSKAFKLDKPCR